MAVVVTAHNLGEGEWLEVWLQLYGATSTKPMAQPRALPPSLLPYLRRVYDACGQELGEPEEVPEYALATPRARAADTTAVVGFSGGKDSVVTALALQASGYDVVLYHLAGLNRSYPAETANARALARRLGPGVRYVERRVALKGKQDWPDVPTKNQLILAAMMVWGSEHGALHYAMGDSRLHLQAECGPEYNLTDAWELMVDFGHHAHHVLGGYQYHAPLRHTADSFAVLVLHRRGLLPLVRGCVAPPRFAGKYRRDNADKYRVQLLPGRCGSCVKCCTEALTLWRMGYQHERYPEPFIEHCLRYLRKVMPRERPIVPDPAALSDAEVEAVYVPRHVVNEVRAALGLELLPPQPLPYTLEGAPAWDDMEPPLPLRAGGA